MLMERSNANNLLQLIGLCLLSGHTDFKIAVSASEQVDEFLFVCGVLHGQVIGQLIQAAHVGGLDGYRLTMGGVLGEEIVKGIGVVQILGDCDMKGLVSPSQSEEAAPQNAEQCHSAPQNHGKQQRIGEISHATDETCTHSEKNHADFLCRSGSGAESHKAKGSGNRHTGSHIPVDHHNDHGNDSGQSGKGHEKAEGTAIFNSEAQGEEHADDQRRPNAEQEGSRFDD